MTPNLGQGGGQALEDAATLTALLTPVITKSGDNAEATEAGSAVDDRLRSYDRLRRKRSQSIAAKSRALGAVFQIQSPLVAGLRDAIFTAVPSRLTAAQAASVQKWEPPST